MRLILFVLTTWEAWLLFHNLKEDKASDFVRILMYFTTWGQIFTTIAIYLGTYLTFAQTKSDDKYSPFCAWKWYILTYEIAFIIEIIITLFYWLILHSEMSQRPPYSTVPIQMVGLIVHHSLPLIMLSTDYLINAIPIVRRHIYLIVPMCSIYLFANFYVTMARGIPIYGIMDWKSVRGYTVAFGTLIAGIVIFLLL